MVDLSAVILSYNTHDITRTTLEKLQESLLKSPSVRSEIIVVDNASQDHSWEMLEKSVTHFRIPFHIVKNDTNVGFPKGNNIGVSHAKGDFILFLNSDVHIESVDWHELLEYMRSHSQMGGLTVRVNLPNGEIDPASHRGFPTLWNSFCYYARLEALTKHIPVLAGIFGGYHLTSQSLDRTHEVDAISGAFFLTKRKAFEEVRGFDEDFFMYGEDIDLAYRMKEKGLSIVYYPEHVVTHLKYQSGIKGGAQKTKNVTKHYFYDAMRIFYRKHYEKKYPSWVNWLVYRFIDLKELV